MKVCGIITEYNPFHLGHQFQIEETKKQLGIDCIIVVMSGHFVQRGEPAIFDKWTRTSLALSGGADIVIELPTPYACASAEAFSYGAVELLHQLGVVDYLCFGSESGDLGPMMELSSFLVNEPANFKNALRSELKSGFSYPKAHSNALKATFHNSDELLKGSNNILGIEYLKALRKLHSPITPYTIKRIGASYLSQSIEDVLPSATAIRKYIKEFDATKVRESLKSAMPEIVIKTLFDQESYTPVFIDHLYIYYQYLLTSTNEAHISEIYDFPLELYRRLLKYINKCQTYTDFIEEVQSKNYTKTMIQRALLHLYLNIKHSDIEKLLLEGNQYIRVLGFRKSASIVLHDIKLQEKLIIVTNYKDHYKLLSDYGKYVLTQESKYSELYNQLITKEYNVIKKNDYLQQIIVLE